MLDPKYCKMAHEGGEVGGDDHTTRYTHAAMYIHIYTS